MINNNQGLTALINELTEKIRSMADKLYKGQENEALCMLPDIIDGLESVMTSYERVTGSPEMILKLNEVLLLANNLISSRDYIQLADIFEYELTGILNDIVFELGTNVKN